MHILAMSDSNLIETPDLVFALPLVPDSHTRAWGITAMVGEVDIELGVVDKDAGGKKSRRVTVPR